MSMAKLLIQQTLGAIESADRPGRYFDVNEMGDFNPQKMQRGGVKSGGQWRGVKSMRTMLPWLTGYRMDSKRPASCT